MNDSITDAMGYVRAAGTKSVYRKHIESFLKSTAIGQSEFLELATKDPKGASARIVSLNPMTVKGLSGAYILNHYCAIKAFLDYNDVMGLNWKKMRKVVPAARRHGDDRAPSLEEIRNMLKFSNPRYRAAILVMASGGVRIGALDYMSMRDFSLFKNGPRVLAGKLVIYRGEPEEYSFLSQISRFPSLDAERLRDALTIAFIGMVRLSQGAGEGGSLGLDSSGEQSGSGGGGTGSFYSTAADKAESKIRYQDSLLDSVADAIIATDLNLAITSWNKGAEKVYGWTAEEALGKNVIDFLKTQFRASTPDDVLARLSREGSVRGEVSQVCKDGRAIDVKGSTSLVEVGGTRVGYVSIGIDITVIRRAEEALKESEETFRSLFESTPIALFEIDVSRVVANITSLSSSTAELIAKTAGERKDILAELLSSLDVKAVNKRSIELFEASGKDELLSHLGYVLTDDTAIKLVEGMATMMTGSTHFAGEAEAKTLRGKEIYVSVDVSPAVSSEVAPTRFVVAFNELTRIKKAEAELRTVASLPEESPSPVLRLASDGTISYSNPAGMAILQAWGSKVGGLAPEVWRKTVREVLAEKGSRIMDMEHGDVFYSISVAPFHEGGYVNLYASDITERKRAEEKLKTYSTRLEGLVQDRTAELEETHRALLEAEGLAAIGRVSTQLAHDLRNPLAGMKMESYVLNELLAKSLDPRARDTLRLLSDSVTHAGKVIEDLLEYTRLQEPFRQQLELGACIADVAAAYPIPKGVILVVKKAPKVHVLAEQGQLVKVVRSLLDNAMEAMPRGGKLIVSFELQGGFVSFSVADTGVGISKGDLPKVFLPFYSTKAKGLGLSLNIARRIIEANGGSMRLKSAQGKGTTVTVTLPAV